MSRGIVEKSWCDRGYFCVVIFQAMGHRCGYIGVDPSYPSYHIDSGELDVHGGVTFDHMSTGKKTRWIGFDAAHCDDGRDYERAMVTFPEEKECLMKLLEFKTKYPLHFDGGTIRNLEYMEAECKRLVDQLEPYDMGIE